MPIKIIGLGEYPVQFGVTGDPERIKKMVKCEHWLDEELDPDRFADKGEFARHGKGIANWPEGERRAELFAVCFDKLFPNFLAVLEARNLPAGYTDLKQAGFPHFATQLTPEKMAERWEQGISWLVLTDEGSLWRGDDGNLYVPCVYCRPGCRDLIAYWVGYDWRPGAFFLFSRERE
jgi:hypothetical protein